MKLKDFFFSLWPLLIVVNYLLIIFSVILVIKSDDDIKNKLINSILIIFIPLIGSIYYLIHFFGMRKKLK